MAYNNGEPRNGHQCARSRLGMLPNSEWRHRASHCRLRGVSFDYSFQSIQDLFSQPLELMLGRRTYDPIDA